MNVVNKRALRDYEVLKKWEAGIVLTGAEAKSVKKGAASLVGSRGMVRQDDVGKQEVWLVGVQINPYEFAKREDYDPKRTRKLLLNKKEIGDIAEKVQQKGLTLVPLKCYNKAGLIKVELALVRGKKEYEKREESKKRDAKREIEQAYKKRRLR